MTREKRLFKRTTVEEDDKRRSRHSTRKLSQTALVTSLLASGVGGNAQARSGDTLSNSQPEAPALIARSADYQVPTATASQENPNDAFRVIDSLVARAILQTQGDPSMKVRDTATIMKELDQGCGMDDLTSFTTNVRGSKIDLTAKLTDAQANEVIAERDYSSPTPANDVIAYEVDCDLVKGQPIEVTPELKGKDGKFRAFGKKVVMNIQDLILIKAGGSRPSKYANKTQLKTKRPLTTPEIKKGKFGLKINQKFSSLDPRYGDKRGFWSRIYVIKKRKGMFNARGTQVVQSASSASVRNSSTSPRR